MECPSETNSFFSGAVYIQRISPGFRILTVPRSLDLVRSAPPR